MQTISREDAIKYAARLYAEDYGKAVAPTIAAMHDILGACALPPKPDWFPEIRRAFDDYALAARDASLGVEHVWTNTQCKAYRTYNPRDCVCAR